jgi:hypothetical protein
VKKIELLILMVMLVIGNAFPCNVPVFRYALERWHPELFQITLLYKDSLSLEERNAAANIEKYCMPGSLDTGNATITTDIQKINAEMNYINISSDLTQYQKTVFGKYISEPLPIIIVNFSPESGIRQPLWTGSIHNREITSVFHSPIRTEISEALLKGITAVWVLVECGDKNKDEKAMNILKTELQKSENNIVLPTLTSQDSTEYIGSGPELKVAFQIRRLSRNNVAEKATLDMLEMTEFKLKEMRNQPIAFPVFARGRVLYAVVGDGINHKMISQTNAYLTGPCACTVKAQNPGQDLLMENNWEKSLGKHYVKEVRAPEKLFGLGQFQKSKKSQ